MRKDLFDELVQSVKEMKAIEAGRIKPSRVTRAKDLVGGGIPGRQRHSGPSSSSARRSSPPSSASASIPCRTGSRADAFPRARRECFCVSQPRIRKCCSRQERACRGRTSRTEMMPGRASCRPRFWHDRLPTPPSRAYAMGMPETIRWTRDQVLNLPADGNRYELSTAS